jgi:hypothetical protein
MQILVIVRCNPCIVCFWIDSKHPLKEGHLFLIYSFRPTAVELCRMRAIRISSIVSLIDYNKDWLGELSRCLF